VDGVLLITGGTGSFGRAVVRRFLKSSLREIRIFSRDEKKQDDMRKYFADPRLKFYLGDVRERESLKAVMRGVDDVFHAAALKQVPSCEFHPMEAVRTNVLGTEHVLDTAIDAGVRRVICLSTDKAVYPINAMGMTKALMEKVMLAAARHSGQTIICGTRYGNVIASRGSVVPLFLNQMLQDRPMTVTDPRMTRFIMTLEDAVELVHFAFTHGRSGDIFVQKAPAATVDTLVQAMRSIMGRPDHPVFDIGTRHGEKLYETLLSREERAAAEDMGRYFRVPPDARDLNYEKYVEKGERRITEATEYTSFNTDQLDVDQMAQLLSNLGIIQRALAGEPVGSED
jgi:UDP-glucose 4-epimerase